MGAIARQPLLQRRNVQPGRIRHEFAIRGLRRHHGGPWRFSQLQAMVRGTDGIQRHRQIQTEEADSLERETDNLDSEYRPQTGGRGPYMA